MPKEKFVWFAVDSHGRSKKFLEAGGDMVCDLWWEIRQQRLRGAWSQISEAKIGKC